MFHMVSETAAQLKARQNKGIVVDRFDVVSCVALEALKSEKGVASTLGRIVRLVIRKAHWIKTCIRVRSRKNSNKY